MSAVDIDRKAAVDRLMRFLAVEGITGCEKAIGREVVAALKEAGVPARAIRFDDANARIPLPTETGNLIVDIAGRGAMKDAEPLLFMTHLDTVPLCAGARPRLAGRKIVNDADTALGGDNRAGCAVLVTLVAELARNKLDHPPLTLLFTVREESGLWGARYVDLAALGKVRCGYNFDGRTPGNVIVGAVGAQRWQAEITGRAAHAGAAPEKGISATLVFANALSAVHARGYFGKVDRDGAAGTSNVGPLMGRNGRPVSDATNVVTDYLLVEGEARSHDVKVIKQITAAYKTAFTEAAAAVTNSAGRAARVRFSANTEYYPYRIKDTLPVVRQAVAALESLGIAPDVRTANGGLDSNWLVRHGIPTVTLGAGQNEVHTVEEWVDLNLFDDACRIACTLATTAG